MNEIMVRIRFQLPSLPRAEKAVAEVLLDTPEALANLTLSRLAEETGSSDASIIRFCKRMGYKGYSEFRTDLLASLKRDDSVDEEPERISDKDKMSDILKKVFQSNMQTLTNTLSLVNPSYEKALEAMLNARSIHFYGVGDAYVVCLLSHMKLTRMGISGSAYSDVVMQLNSAANLEPGDVAFAISYEGRSRNVLEAMKVAKERGATTICITKRSKSQLVKLSDIALFISTSDLTVGRTIVARRVADQAIMEALLVGITVRKGREYHKKVKVIQEAIDRNKI